MTDEQIIEGCKQKDARAQKALFEKYASTMLGICMRYMKAQQEAEDVLQDGFIKVFEKFDKFKNEGSLEGWIKRIMVNTALDQLRKDKKRNHHLDVDEVDYLLESNDMVIESLSAENLLKILNTIPEGYKVIFNLYAIEGYSHKEIAEKLDITESTSKSQYSRAKAYLRKLMIEYKIVEVER